MSEATNYLENALANHLCKVATYTPPAALYLALYTVAPTDSTAGTEVTGSGYVRQPVTWSAASSGICTNSGAIEFPNTQFAILNDASIDALNVTSLIFADTQGAFLAGYSAALVSKTLKVAMIASPSQADIYQNGFVAGVLAADVHASAPSVWHDEIVAETQKEEEEEDEDEEEEDDEEDDDEELLKLAGGLAGWMGHHIL